MASIEVLVEQATVWRAPCSRRHGGIDFDPILARPDGCWAIDSRRAVGWNSGVARPTFSHSDALNWMGRATLELGSRAGHLVAAESARSLSNYDNSQHIGTNFGTLFRSVLYSHQRCGRAKLRQGIYGDTRRTGKRKGGEPLYPSCGVFRRDISDTSRMRDIWLQHWVFKFSPS